MRRALIVGVAGLLIGSGATFAFRTYTVYGFGTKSCGKWTEAVTAASLRRDIADRYIDMANEQWIAGFVSGAGYTDSKAFRDADIEGIRAFVNNYCTAHPLDKMGDAAEKLIEELEKKR
jgi:hypothetical protein